MRRWLATFGVRRWLAKRARLRTLRPADQAHIGPGGDRQPIGDYPW